MNDELTELVPVIRRFAYSLTGHKHDADDLLQGTIERLLSKAVPEDVPLLKWAFRVCRNLWFDEYRARRVRQKAAQSAELSEDNSFDGERAVYHQIQLREVNEALDNLPEEQRVILSLVAVQGLSYKDIAEELNIPMGTVMSRIARARVALSESLNTAKVRTSV